MSIAVSILLLILTLIAYRQMVRDRSQRGLFILRLLVLLLFFFLLTGQMIKINWQRRARQVAIMIDRSASMAAIKADSAATAVCQLVSTGLPKGLLPRCYSFGESLYPGVNPGQRFDRTELAKALALVFKTKPAAVVLLTDGQDNGEQSPVPVVQGSGIPVYVIGFGAERGFNLRVEEVELPATAYAKDTVEIRVRVLSSGLKEPTPVQVCAGDKSQLVLAGSGISEQDIEFSLIFNEPGKKQVLVRLESLPGELSFLDNRWQGIIEVKPARIGVAYITNQPGPNTRFVLAALRRNQRVDLKPVVLFTGNLKELPVAEVFIIDNGAEQTLENLWWQRLQNNIENGAGLLVLAGPGFQPGPTLRKLIPLTNWSEQKGNWTPVKTPAAELIGLFEPGGIDLNELPPFSGLVSGSNTGTGEVWLEAGENGLPLIIQNRVKKGKLIYVAGYPFWRWGFLPDYPIDRQTPLEIFLDRVIRYLGEKDTTLFKLETDAASYLSGEPVRFRLSARRADGGFWEGLNVQLKIDTIAQMVPMVELGAGRYEAKIAGLAPGEHYAVAEVRSAEQLLGRVRAEWTVSAQSLEMTRLGLNRTLLSQIAEAGQGWLVSSESLTTAQLQEIKVRVYQQRLLLDPRILPWWFVLLAVLFGLEIFLRRRQGLY